MTSHLILHLRRIFDAKTKIFNNFHHLVKPVSDAASDIANIYTDEFQRLIGEEWPGLKKRLHVEIRPFRKYGFLALAQSLISLHMDFDYYWDNDDNESVKEENGSINVRANIVVLSQSNPKILQLFDEMVGIVNDEQKYLVSLTESLEQIKEKKDRYMELWSKSLKGFKGFMLDFDEDLDIFKALLFELIKSQHMQNAMILLRNKRSEIKNRLIGYLNSQDWRNAEYLVHNLSNHKYFSREEVALLNNLVDIIQNKDVNRLEILLREKYYTIRGKPYYGLFRQIFDNPEEIVFFSKILEEIKQVKKPISPQDLYRSLNNPTVLAQALVNEAKKWQLIRDFVSKKR